ncbi:TIGR03986 family type III CRISPR-associated RAMP protein [Propionibacterium australiense]|uniref:TIGR03986 family CRISPR-associated RAMP protein n=1 Tax=Propionibacterium australiense TaxID=119981 RepID=A0A8B3FI88_9ACTN|nr:TIGR03986 family CRISPR-associated RAMP protein [Propionibacterium australiense]RLP08361.1 TIGR03986 family CRISPR-associated RAMP protein [Propionibacterium australiense]
MGEHEQFHSAVNRIPVLRRPSHAMADKGLLPKDLFSDGPATGHDHLAADRWSGSIDLEMTVRTPLVFGEQKNKKKDSQISLPMRGDELVVPPTMVKGMISRAFEILTCSRFRVFGAVENTSGLRGSKNDHSQRLTYRADPAAANNLFPGRVRTTEDGGLAVEILDGKSRQFRSALIRDDVKKGHGRILSEGHPGIPSDHRNTIKKVLQRFRDLTPHGQWTKVRITEWQKTQEKQTRQREKKKRTTKYFMVTGVWRGTELEEFFSVTGENEEIHDVWGYPCRTSPDGKTSRELYADKIYERFFFKANGNGDPLPGSLLPLNASHLEGYAEVLRTYREQRELPGGDKHLLNRAAASSSDSLTEGDLVFVQLANMVAPDQHATHGTGHVVSVFPTMVGRRPYSKSPRELAAAQNVLSVTTKTEASAADRVFGYVVSEVKEGATGGDVAAQGHLSFGVVDISDAHVSTSPKQLAPLLSPKPSSARRFLTDNDAGATPTNNGQPLARYELFADGQALGAAAYPIHRELLDCSDSPESATNPVHTLGSNQDNDAVRTTAMSWVKTGSVLRCTIRFTNLSRKELGALIWVLTPENLVPEEEQKDPPLVGFLRMGVGKPLGLGAIETRIIKNGLRATQGCNLATAYENLSGCLDSKLPTAEIKNFSLQNEEDPLHSLRIKALQRAAFGYTDNTKTRYMTLEENKDNNQTDKRGKPREGRGLSPVDLFTMPPGAMSIQETAQVAPEKQKKNAR